LRFGIFDHDLPLTIIFLVPQEMILVSLAELFKQQMFFAEYPCFLGVKMVRLSSKGRPGRVAFQSANRSSPCMSLQRWRLKRA